MGKKKLSADVAPSLQVILSGFVLATTVLSCVAGYYVLTQRVESFQRAGLARAVQTRVTGAQVALGQALQGEWVRLRNAAKQVSLLTPIEIQHRLNAMTDAGSVSWAGFARSDGTVLAASNGLLVNVDVSSRPWFQRGLEGNFAGDVHEAVLLASKLPQQTRDEPLRFLDMATPIVGAGGVTEGVLGVHLDFTWARRIVQQMADALQVDLFIVNSAGQTVMATVDGRFGALDLPSYRAARAGNASVNVEQWPDGRTYYTATLPERTVDDLPRFGWSVIARIDASGALSGSQDFSRQLIEALVVYAIAIILLTTLFIAIFIRPFGRLARNAMSVAEGSDTYPFESRRTRELAMMSAALSRLQADRRADDH
jgi:hypothetical protein